VRQHELANGREDVRRDLEGGGAQTDAAGKRRNTVATAPGSRPIASALELPSLALLQARQNSLTHRPPVYGGRGPPMTTAPNTMN
jgi:hypothetical protein